MCFVNEFNFSFSDLLCELKEENSRRLVVDVQVVDTKCKLFVNENNTLKYSIHTHHFIVFLFIY